MVDPKYDWRLALHAMDLDASGHDTLSSSGPFVDVTTFGATGDGTTDDTSAIQDAIDSIDTTGGTIWFPIPSVYYKITATLTFAGPRYHVLGAGTRYGPSRIHMATANTTALSFVTTTLSGFRIETSLVENLFVSGPGTNVSVPSSGRGIYASSDVFCKEVAVSGFYDGFYWGGSTYYSYARDCFATNCAHAGYSLISTNNCVLDNCRAIGAYSNTFPLGPMQYGAFINGGGSIGLGNRIIGGSFEYFSKSGIYVDGGGPVSIIGGPYLETQQSSSGYAHIEVGASSEVRALTIEGAYLQGDGTAGFDGVKLGKVNTFHIHGCRFGINGAIGISSTADTSGGFVWGNYNSPAGTFTLPADTVTSPGGAAFATPAVVLGTAAAAGAATTVIRSDSTIVAFDATAPTTSAIGDAAATGSAAIAARRDHAHGREALSTATPLVESGAGAVGTGVKSSREDHVHPAATSAGVGAILISDTPAGSPLVFADLIQNEAGTDLVYADI